MSSEFDTNIKIVGQRARCLHYMVYRLFIGESFVEATEDSAQEYIEKRVEVDG